MPKHGSRINDIDVVSATEDADNSYDMNGWIFHTTNGGPSNCMTKDSVPITFVQK